MYQLHLCQLQLYYNYVRFYQLQLQYYNYKQLQLGQLQSPGIFL